MTKIYGIIYIHFNVKLVVKYDQKYEVNINMYNFKKFEKTNQRVENRITISASNSIGFPTKFFQDNHIGDYKYVVLYYDEIEKAVGIQFTNDEEEKHKFTLVKSKIGYGASIVATSFFKVNGIDAKLYRNKYDWEKVTEDGIGELYVIKLQPHSQEAPV